LAAGVDSIIGSSERLSSCQSDGRSHFPDGVCCQTAHPTEPRGHHCKESRLKESPEAFLGTQVCGVYFGTQVGGEVYAENTGNRKQIVLAR